MNRKHLLVCGGGFSGTMAAIACQSFFDKITILERFPDAKAQRYAGTPQSHHVHIMLKKGQLLLEEFIPGILRSLEDSGARRADWSKNTVWTGAFGEAMRFESGVESLLFSRKLLEEKLKEILATFSHVEVIAAQVLRVELKDGRAQRVCLKDGQAIEDFDLLIDARGRNSTIKADIEAYCQAIPELSLNNTLRYVSTVVDHQFEEGGIYQHYRQANAKSSPLGYYASSIEGERVLFTAVDYHSQFTNPFQELAEHPFLKGKKLGEIYGFTKLHNQHIRYGKAKRWISNLLIIGDSVCRLNPVYGQGLTLILEEMKLLHRALARMDTLNTRKVQAKIDTLLTKAWQIVWLDELRSPSQKPGRMASLLHAALDIVGEASLQDRELNRLSLGLLHRIESPAAYLRPDRLARVLWGYSRHFLLRFKTAKQYQCSNRFTPCYRYLSNLWRRGLGGST